MTLERLRVDSPGEVIRVSVHMQPRASLTEIVGRRDAALKVRLETVEIEGASEADVRRLADGEENPMGGTIR